MTVPEPNDNARIGALLARGRRLHRDGDLDAAMRCYRRILDERSEHGDALYLSALVLHRRGRFGEALELARRAIAAAPGNALAHAGLGQMLQDAGRDDEAVAHLARAADLPGANAAVFNALGVSLMRTGDQAGASLAFDRAVELSPGAVQGRLNRANLDRLRGRPEAALAGYGHCLSLAPNHAEANNNLGVLHHERRCPALAVRHFEAAIAARPSYAEAHNNLGAALAELGDTARALGCFRRAAELAPDFVEARINAAITRQGAGFHDEARRVLDEAVGLVPGDPAIAWSRCMAALESVYRSDAHLAEARAEYRERLGALAARAAGGRARAAIDRCIGLVQPFLLPYQGEDDLVLQSMYGDLVCGGTPTPEYRAAPAADSRPVRVGIVSGFFFDHSNWKVPISGWLPTLSSAFEVHGYYTGVREDECTAAARDLCNRFHAGRSEGELASAIVEEAIDVLIYPEIGMNPATTRLAARRLAPVQCASWGHPVTTGFPTMDYFLSSELMEPAGADAHYRERLVLLPGLSFTCKAPAAVPFPAADRHKFGLDDDDFVYLCVQNPSKYLPGFDRLLVSISERVANARFVFVAGTPGTTAALRRRLDAAFGGAGGSRRCVTFLERLSRPRFGALHNIADAVLDPTAWSGCNTTLDAFAAGLPVVTLPGRFMRGRHTLAFYRRMNHDDLVARDEGHYVDLAARLALDGDWHARQRQLIADRRHLLYDDGAPARALVEFIERAARATRGRRRDA